MAGVEGEAQRKLPSKLRAGGVDQPMRARARVYGGVDDVAVCGFVIVGIWNLEGSLPV